MSEFYVGQKVVCVDDKLGPNPILATPWRLVRGNEYTVRWVGWYEHKRSGLIFGVRLSGIERVQPRDTPYRANRFAPLESKAIQLFRKIAADATSKRKITVVEPDRVRARAAHNEVR